MLLTVIVLSASYFSSHKCFACSNYDGSTNTEAADPHQKNTCFSNLEHEISADDADGGTQLIITSDRGAPNEPVALANGASNDETKKRKVLKDAYAKEVADIKEKRNNV